MLTCQCSIGGHWECTGDPCATTVGPSTTATLEPPPCSCPDGYYNCADCSMCILEGNVCDGERNCGDGSDEQGCPCTDATGVEYRDGAMYWPTECKYCRCDNGVNVCEKQCNVSCSANLALNMFENDPDRCCACTQISTTVVTVITTQTTPISCTACHCVQNCDGSSNCHQVNPCVEGCAHTCPDGYVWQGEYCVRMAVGCACIYNDIHYENGTSWDAGECRRCTCVNFESNCVPQCNIGSCALGEELIDDTGAGECCYCRPATTTIQTTTISTATTERVCDAAMGMASRRILPSQLHYSSREEGTSDPNGVGRIGGNAWIPSGNSNSEHIEVTFRSPQEISGLAIQGGSNIEQGRVTQFQIRYSQDPERNEYTNYQEVTGTQEMIDKVFTVVYTDDNNDPFRIYLSEPLLNIYAIVIVPVNWDTRIYLKMELYGCGEFIPSTRVPTTQSTTTSTTTQSTTLEVCDYPLGMENGEIPDSSISYSTTSLTSGEGSGRFNGRDWEPTADDGDQYIEVEFSGPTVITSFDFQRSPDPESPYITEFRIEYITEEGGNYVDDDTGATKLFLADLISSNSDTTEDLGITDVVGIRLDSMDANYTVSIYGCPLSISSTTVTTQTTTITTTASTTTIVTETTVTTVEPQCRYPLLAGGNYSNIEYSSLESSLNPDAVYGIPTSLPWMPLNAGIAGNRNEFIRITFDEPKDITEISVNGDEFNRVTMFTVMFGDSTDSLSTIKELNPNAEAESLLDKVFDVTDTTSVRFSSVVQAQVIQVIPYGWVGRMTMTVELYGCPLGILTTTAQPTTAERYTTIKELTPPPTTFPICLQCICNEDCYGNLECLGEIGDHCQDCYCEHEVRDNVCVQTASDCSCRDMNNTQHAVGEEWFEGECRSCNCDETHTKTCTNICITTTPSGTTGTGPTGTGPPGTTGTGPPGTTGTGPPGTTGTGPPGTTGTGPPGTTGTGPPGTTGTGPPGTTGTGPPGTTGTGPPGTTGTGPTGTGPPGTTGQTGSPGTTTSHTVTSSTGVVTRIPPTPPSTTPECSFDGMVVQDVCTNQICTEGRVVQILACNKDNSACEPGFQLVDYNDGQRCCACEPIPTFTPTTQPICNRDFAPGNPQCCNFISECSIDPLYSGSEDCACESNLVFNGTACVFPTSCLCMDNEGQLRLPDSSWPDDRDPDCSTCTCFNNDYTCARQPCERQPNCPEEQLVTLEGECCPVCPPSTTESPTPPPTTESPTPPPTTESPTPPPTTESPTPQCYEMANAYDYRGSVHTTTSGFTCQDWSSQTPHSHSFTPESYPNDGLLNNNNCRNPDQDTTAWCYTTDPNRRWEFCDVGSPSESCEITSTVTPTTTVTPTGTLHPGTTTGTPHSPTTTPGTPHPPTTTPGTPTETTEEVTTVSTTPSTTESPTPPPTECYEMSNAYDYRGSVHTTTSGFTCQDWSSQTPHSHSFTPESYPNDGLLNNNNCRNPDQDDTAWCYTTDPNRRWEFCDVGSPSESCASSTTESPTPPPTTESPTPPPTTESPTPPPPTTTTESPTPPPTECYEMSNAYDYRGSVHTTTSGFTCQDWSSQTPHSHSYTPESYPNDGLLNNNNCRNPDQDNTAWCYTTDPNRRWEFCDVGSPSESCASSTTESPTPPPTTESPTPPPPTTTTESPTPPPTECYEMSNAYDYRGSVHTTTSGFTCQDWSSQTPHSHSFTPESYPNDGLLNNNNCRNPDQDTTAWCYTTDPNRRWEFCDVGSPSESCEVVSTTRQVSTPGSTCPEGRVPSDCYCTLTCSDLADGIEMCDTSSGCTPGCNCAPGLVEHNGFCIEMTECPCYDSESNEFYQLLSTWRQGNCHVCVCQATQIECSQSECNLQSCPAGYEIQTTADRCCECALIQTTVIPTTSINPCFLPYVYRETCDCHTTCENRNFVCQEGCESGCFCPEGMVRNEDSCVLPEHCPCDYDGVVLQYQEAIQVSDCTTCQCEENGEVNCTKTCGIEECGNNQILIEPDGIRCCYCETMTTLTSTTLSTLITTITGSNTTVIGTTSYCDGCLSGDHCIPVGDSFTVDECTNCTCESVGQELCMTQSCEISECPPNYIAWTDEGRCCPTCQYTTCEGLHLFSCGPSDCTNQINRCDDVCDCPPRCRDEAGCNELTTLTTQTTTEIPHPPPACPHGQIPVQCPADSGCRPDVCNNVNCLVESDRSICCKCIGDDRFYDGTHCVPEHSCTCVHEGQQYAYRETWRSATAECEECLCLGTSVSCYTLDRCEITTPPVTTLPPPTTATASPTTPVPSTTLESCGNMCSCRLDCRGQLINPECPSQVGPRCSRCICPDNTIDSSSYCAVPADDCTTTVVTTILPTTTATPCNHPENCVYLLTCDEIHLSDAELAARAAAALEPACLEHCLCPTDSVPLDGACIRMNHTCTCEDEDSEPYTIGNCLTCQCTFLPRLDAWAEECEEGCVLSDTDCSEGERVENTEDGCCECAPFITTTTTITPETTTTVTVSTTATPITSRFPSTTPTIPVITTTRPPTTTTETTTTVISTTPTPTATPRVCEDILGMDTPLEGDRTSSSGEETGESTNLEGPDPNPDDDIEEDGWIEIVYDEPVRIDVVKVKGSDNGYVGTYEIEYTTTTSDNPVSVEEDGITKVFIMDDPLPRDIPLDEELRHVTSIKVIITSVVEDVRPIIHIDFVGCDERETTTTLTTASTTTLSTSTSTTVHTPTPSTTMSTTPTSVTPTVEPLCGLVDSKLNNYETERTVDTLEDSLMRSAIGALQPWAPDTSSPSSSITISLSGPATLSELDFETAGYIGTSSVTIMIQTTDQANSQPVNEVGTDTQQVYTVDFSDGRRVVTLNSEELTDVVSVTVTFTVPTQIGNDAVVGLNIIGCMENVESTTVVTTASTTAPTSFSTMVSTVTTTPHSTVSRSTVTTTGPCSEILEDLIYTTRLTIDGQGDLTKFASTEPWQPEYFDPAVTIFYDVPVRVTGFLTKGANGGAIGSFNVQYKHELDEEFIQIPGPDIGEKVFVVEPPATMNTEVQTDLASPLLNVRIVKIFITGNIGEGTFPPPVMVEPLGCIEEIATSTMSTTTRITTTGKLTFTISLSMKK
ncbi:uncharacterized protein LOC117114763 [Anneissia japonica]|uniref:uncharacterized protein LOC117114763 n=1 Tax=Anneissia japonica TaxID=1529436 RepID=UPI0014254D20|nr:uncharacterized protein LOC117114763 [Anneissia japonica]